MKSFIVGLAIFSGILVAIYLFSTLLSMLGFSSDTIGTLFFVGMILFMAKPFGELTMDMYRRK